MAKKEIGPKEQAQRDARIRLHAAQEIVAREKAAYEKAKRERKAKE